MLQKLPLSKNRLENKVKPAKVRDLASVPTTLWQYIQELCEGRRKWPLFIHGSVGTGKSYGLYAWWIEWPVRNSGRCQTS